ncbi:hypothetical protein NQK81_02205 [Amycolatopsis roodepoortensis]|uniref:hypothetical protein n=1 Tax=Amycolatopsis roodepoortensis TaxID=700274 RepID=UPI00214A8B76|nr:hypothetical protein [Amycolatopsis roodepoortensis]UUV32287.1 hypothetical protein NQK81_02205 [Amycolatopsis roodepoortensis]
MSQGFEVQIGTWNTWERGMYPKRAGEKERYDGQVEVMRTEFPCHVWAVQEIGNLKAFRMLADDLEMNCMVRWPGWWRRSRPAFDPGGHGFGVGVLWDPAIEAIPNGIVAMRGAMRTYTRDVFFHGVASTVLDIGGHPIHIASGHATPWGAPQILGEAKRWGSIMTRPHRGLPGNLGKRVIAGMLNTDSNGITGDKIRGADGTWHYHMADPFQGRAWIPDMIYQVPQPYVVDHATGKPVPICDRAQGDILWAGGLRDTSAVLDLPFEPTTGYHPVDPFMPRDIDHQRVNTEMLELATVVSVEVLKSARAERLTDHRAKRTTLRLPSAA